MLLEAPITIEEWLGPLVLYCEDCDGQKLTYVDQTIQIKGFTFLMKRKCQDCDGVRLNLKMDIMQASIEQKNVVKQEDEE